MNYLDIISVEEAKNYLRIDDTNNHDDAQIQMMIEAALKYVEDWTNYRLVDLDKSFDLINGEVRVYDFPINTEITDGLVSEVKGLYSIYCFEDGTTDEPIILNVGYTVRCDIPMILITVAYEVLSLYYYQGDDQTTKGVVLSPLGQDTLNRMKRFIF